VCGDAPGRAQAALDIDYSAERHYLAPSSKQRSKGAERLWRA
jgi:hypothetical protein